jgi:hypothetical protein
MRRYWFVSKHSALPLPKHLEERQSIALTHHAVFVQDMSPGEAEAEAAGERAAADEARRLYKQRVYVRGGGAAGDAAAPATPPGLIPGTEVRLPAPGVGTPLTGGAHAGGATAAALATPVDVAPPTAPARALEVATFDVDD